MTSGARSSRSPTTELLVLQARGPSSTSWTGSSMCPRGSCNSAQRRTGPTRPLTGRVGAVAIVGGQEVFLGGHTSMIAGTWYERAGGLKEEPVARTLGKGKKDDRQCHHR